MLQYRFWLCLLLLWSPCALAQTRYSAVLTGTINGGAGIDTLDYSAWTAEHPVNVNISLGTAMNISGPTSGHAENYDVDTAVRNWAWEAKSVEQKPSRSYDFQELWLAR